MRALTAQDILHTWESGQGQHPVDRALTLLAAGYPAATRAMLAALTIGGRDARLLALHELTFGGSLHCGDACPRCSIRVEFSAAPAELRASAGHNAGGQLTPQDEGFEADGICVRFHLPTSVDIAAAAGCRNAADARAVLLRQCVTAATENGEPVGVEALPEGVIARLAQQMAELDPQAEIVLGLTCPACGHQWQSLLDIADFFWAELTAHAQRLLADVHTLASAYGWREADILAMPSMRRQFYLEMIGA